MADWTPPTKDRVEGYFKELNNWGRWGHDDQRGTANLITPAKRAQAAALVRSGRTVSLARDLGLSFHGKPSNACLSSRISYGEVITLDKLHRVETAEEAIRALGFPVVRVRAHEGIARIEVPKEDLPRIVEPAVAAKVARAVREAGFVYVTIDLLGYRSGSMNEGL